jgi:hypothetical protein
MSTDRSKKWKNTILSTFMCDICHSCLTILLRCHRYVVYCSKIWGFVIFLCLSPKFTWLEKGVCMRTCTYLSRLSNTWPLNYQLIESPFFNFKCLSMKLAYVSFPLLWTIPHTYLCCWWYKKAAVMGSKYLCKTCGPYFPLLPLTASNYHVWQSHHPWHVDIHLYVYHCIIQAT